MKPSVKCSVFCILLGVRQASRQADRQAGSQTSRQRQLNSRHDPLTIIWSLEVAGSTSSRFRVFIQMCCIRGNSQAWAKLSEDDRQAAFWAIFTQITTNLTISTHVQDRWTFNFTQIPERLQTFILPKFRLLRGFFMISWKPNVRQVNSRQRAGWCKKIRNWKWTIID